MMDRRLLERRRRVAEERARSSLGRLIRVLMVLAAVALVVWFAQSPFVSVQEIVVEGNDRVDVASVLAANGVVEGRPMLVIDVDAAERALAQDQWVAEATVAREWPQTVRVLIEERRPAVTVQLEDGQWLVAADATMLDPVGDEQPDLPRAILPDLDESAARDDLVLRGAVEYLVNLPPDLRAGAEITSGRDGLVAMVGGYEVRVGRPFDTGEKATVTAAMIQGGVEEGSILTVVAPANPAVLPPGAEDDEAAPSTPTTSIPDE